MKSIAYHATFVDPLPCRLCGDVVRTGIIVESAVTEVQSLICQSCTTAVMTANPVNPHLIEAGERVMEQHRDAFRRLADR